jgi:hypothetical protein
MSMKLENKELFKNKIDLSEIFLYPKLISLNDEDFHHLGLPRKKSIFMIVYNCANEKLFLVE